MGVSRSAFSYQQGLEPPVDPEAKVRHFIAAAIHRAQVFHAEEDLVGDGDVGAQAQGQVLVVFTVGTAAGEVGGGFDVGHTDQAVGAYRQGVGELATEVGAVHAVNFQVHVVAQFVIADTQAQAQFAAEGFILVDPGAEFELQGVRLGGGAGVVRLDLAADNFQTGVAACLGEHGQSQDGG